MNTFARRVLGAAVLDRRTYEEVEADARATGQAVGVVVLASVAGGIGLLGLGAQTLQSLVAGIIGSLIGWMAWAALTSNRHAPPAGASDQSRCRRVAANDRLCLFPGHSNRFSRKNPRRCFPSSQRRSSGGLSRLNGIWPS